MPLLAMTAMPAPAVYDSEGELVTPEVTPLPEDWTTQ